MFDVTPCFHIEEVLLKFILLLTAPRESDHLLHIALPRTYIYYNIFYIIYKKGKHKYVTNVILNLSRTPLRLITTASYYVETPSYLI